VFWDVASIMEGVEDPWVEVATRESSFRGPIPKSGGLFSCVNPAPL